MAQITENTSAPIFASLSKKLIEEKKKEEPNSTIIEIPLLEDKTIYYTDDDFEPIGCHGCGDW